jgi:hypothetical protein
MILLYQVKRWKPPQKTSGVQWNKHPKMTVNRTKFDGGCFNVDGSSSSCGFWSFRLNAHQRNACYPGSVVVLLYFNCVECKRMQFLRLTWVERINNADSYIFNILYCTPFCERWSSTELCPLAWPARKTRSACSYIPIGTIFNPGVTWFNQSFEVDSWSMHSGFSFI